LYASNADSVAAANITGTILLGQLPDAVITNGEASVTLSNAALSGSLSVPGNINSGGSLLLHSDTNQNFFSGTSAGGATTSGQYNTATGYQALYTNTSGSYNTADGNQALYNNNGAGNTAVGAGALSLNTSGGNNIALGYQAGFNITGSGNIDIGNTGYATDNNVIRIGTNQTATYLVGTVYASGVSISSDRNAKENFAPVDSQSVLAKVAALPVTQWNYKKDSNGVQHIGPMAQDFQTTFGLDGADDKHISVVDEGGVALAAIQGLNQKVDDRNQSLENLLKQKEVEIQALKAKAAQVDSLEKRLNELEETVRSLVAKR
jgi:hypothetical protein